MAEEVGYSVVHIAGTESVLLVRTDLLGGECPPPYAQFSNRVQRKDTCVLDPHRVGKWVEYATYRDLEEAHGGRRGTETVTVTGTAMAIAAEEEVEVEQQQQQQQQQQDLTRRQLGRARLAAREQVLLMTGTDRSSASLGLL